VLRALREFTTEALHTPVLNLPSHSRYSFTNPERMEGWGSPGPGCKEQLAHGATVATWRPAASGTAGLEPTTSWHGRWSSTPTTRLITSPKLDMLNVNTMLTESIELDIYRRPMKSLWDCVVELVEVWKRFVLCKHFLVVLCELRIVFFHFESNSWAILWNFESLSLVSKVTSSKYLLNKFICFYGTTLLWF